MDRTRRHGAAEDEAAHTHTRSLSVRPIHLPLSPSPSVKTGLRIALLTEGWNTTGRSLIYISENIAAVNMIDRQQESLDLFLCLRSSLSVRSTRGGCDARQRRETEAACQPAAKSVLIARVQS